MKFWKALQALFSPTFAEDVSIQDVRDYLVVTVLRAAAILGMFALVVNLPVLIRKQLWGYVTLYVLVEVWLLTVSLSSRPSYTIRVSTLLTTLYLIGVTSTLEYATIGDGRIWMIGFVILATIFLGLRAGLHSAILTTLTMLFIGWLMSASLIPVPVFNALGLPGNFDTWLYTSTSYFIINVLALASTATLLRTTSQAAEERQRLIQHLERDRLQAEERARELERRQQQLYTAAEITGVLGRERDLNSLLQSVVDLLTSRFDLYYSGIFLLDEQGLYALLSAGSGEAGKKMREAGHRLAIGGTSMIGWCIAHRKARIALDTGEEAIRFDNPLLPLTRSELALPIMLGERVLGALTVQSTQPNAFDEADIAILNGIASALATAIENVRLVQRLQRSLDEVKRLNQQFLMSAWQRETISKEAELRYEVENPAAPSVLPEDRSLEVPVTLRDVQIGVVKLEGAQPWDEQDAEFAKAVAAQAAQALENARLVQETLRQAQREQVVASIAEQVRNSLDLETVLRTSVQEIRKTLRLRRVRIRLQEDAPLEASRNHP